MINDLLDIEKIQSGRMDFQIETIPVPLLLEKSLAANQGYAGKHRVPLVLEPPTEKLSIDGDENRLLQVLSNLLSNAIKFSPPGEPVTLACERVAERARLSVQDRGPGIPAAYRDKIFEKFIQVDSSDTRSRGGTGLGLAISRTIVENLGGTIRFDTREEGGTTFFVDFPLTKMK